MATLLNRATAGLLSRMEGASSSSNKRKRGEADLGEAANNKRPSQGNTTTNGSSHDSNPSGASFSNAPGMAPPDTQASIHSSEDMSAMNQQLLQEHNQGYSPNGDRSNIISAAKAASGLASSMSGPPHNDMSFVSTGSAGDSAFGASSQHNYPDPTIDMNAYHTPGSTAAQVEAARAATNMSHQKHPVGSPEWHAQRKSSHKEVERRRRETINEGINELAKIVPNCEKNKGQILQETVRYIRSLQDNERQSTKNVGFEKMTLEQALREVTVQNDKLKSEIQRAWNEGEKWEKRCREAGLQFSDYNSGSGDKSDLVDDSVDPAIDN